MAHGSTQRGAASRDSAAPRPGPRALAAVEADRPASLHVLPLGPREEGLLLAQLQAGDPEAFALLYHHFVGRVLGLARQMLREPAAAEDATQETFLRVYRSIHRFRGEARLATWIHRIAANVCLNEVARRQRCPERPDPRVGSGDEEPGSLPAPSSAAGHELRLSLEQVLGRLAPDKRLAFYLCHVEGLSAAEIAGITGETDEAIHKRLQRARRELLALWTGAAATEAAPGNAPARARPGAPKGGQP